MSLRKRQSRPLAQRAVVRPTLNPRQVATQAARKVTALVARNMKALVAKVNQKTVTPNRVTLAARWLKYPAVKLRGLGVEVAAVPPRQVKEKKAWSSRKTADTDSNT